MMHLWFAELKKKIFIRLADLKETRAYEVDAMA